MSRVENKYIRMQVSHALTFTHFVIRNLTFPSHCALKLRPSNANIPTGESSACLLAWIMNPLNFIPMVGLMVTTGKKLVHCYTNSYYQSMHDTKICYFNNQNLRGKSRVYRGGALAEKLTKPK